jgi:hypothetical protein
MIYAPESLDSLIRSRRSVGKTQPGGVMQQNVVYEGQPVGQPIGTDVNPDWALGVVIALILALLIVRYLKVILLLIVIAVIAMLVVGAAAIEPLITAAVDALRAGR